MKNVTFAVYEYPELSETAKEKAKQWYLNDDLRADSLTEYMEIDAAETFPNSSLGIQWSLSSCQGDGVNIHGDLCAADIIEKMDIDAKAKRRLYHYMGQLSDALGEIELQRNRRYTYCTCNTRYMLNMLEDWTTELEEQRYRNIDKILLGTFAHAVQKVVTGFCAKWEKFGYEYLYNVEESEMVDMCEANEYYFYADGAFYG